MHLHAVCYYRSRSDTWSDKWRNEDYSAMNLVKAVKSLHFGGSSSITQGGSSYSITNTTEGRARALMIAARALAGKIHKAGYEAVSVMPVPSSAHITPEAMFTGRRLAEAIEEAHKPFVAAPTLYFDQTMPPARGGGNRNPNTIQPHLRIAAPPPTGRVVLLDDVCTSGGHLIAAARFLRQHGIQVQDAFVIGRTCWDRPDSMWSVATENLATETLFDI
jgi:hypothetical protein